MSVKKSAVLNAADALVDAFMSHNRAGYFEAFAPEATFLFHNLPELLETRDSYEALWTKWEQENGFKVLGGISSGRRVDLFGNTAVFTHEVATTMMLDGVKKSSQERETIIFHLAGGRWLAVHEHLSPMFPG